MDEGFGDIFLQLLVLFLIMAVGFVCKRIGLMDETLDRGLSKLVLNITMPAMILAAPLTAEELPTAAEVGFSFCLSCAAYALVVVLAYAAVKLLGTEQGRKGTFRFMMVFGNVGFIGFPVLAAIFGNEAVIYAAIFNIPFNMLVFTLGIWFLVQDASAAQKIEIGWKTFASPCLITCLLAAVFCLLRIHGIPFVGDALDTLGSFTTPAALIVVGSSLANLPLKELAGDAGLLFAGFFRVAVAPVSIWAVFHLLPVSPMLLAIMVVVSGMPVATNGTMLSYQYGGNPKTMAQGTFISTVLSLVTIPLLVFFFGGLTSTG